jgi:D-alanyl-D-alanine carboxypeptidase
MTTQPTPSEIHPSRRRTRRHLRRAAAAALGAAALLAPTVSAAGAATPAHHAPRPVGARLQAILDRAVKAPGAQSPGVALYVRRPGHAVWAGAAGQASVRPARRMRAADRFRAGSLMKPLVAAATLQLVEEGRIGLDDPLPAVLPARIVSRFADADRITVRMLLQHTSGLGDYTSPAFDREVAADPARRWTVDELLDRAAAQPRTFAPGERFAYSNTDYNLLGLILERATGKPWRAVVRERVIERLHLNHTTLPQPGHTPAGRDIAHGYQTLDGKVYDLTDVDSSMAGAAGGQALLTNAEDLTRFLRGLLAGRLFHNRQTLEEMRTFVATHDDTGRVGYGLGLERYVLPGGTELVGHMGTAAGYRTLMFRLPAQHIDFTLTMNNPGDPLPVLLPALKVLTAGRS